MARITERRDLNQTEFQAKILDILESEPRGIGISSYEIKCKLGTRDILVRDGEVEQELLNMEKLGWVQFLRKSTPQKVIISEVGRDAYKTR